MMTGGLSVSLAEVFLAAFQAHSSDTWTQEPCTVDKYDGATRTADLQPMVQRAVPDDNGDYFHESLPIVPNVPVLFLGAGAGSGRILMTWKLVKGDEGVMFVSSSATSNFRESGAVSPPGDLRRSALGSGFFLPCALSKRKVDAEGSGGDQGTEDAFIITAPEIRLGDPTADDWVALASLVSSRLDTIQQGFDTHKHAVPAFGDSGVPTALLGPLDPVAATKVKAK